MYTEAANRISPQELFNKVSQCFCTELPEAKALFPWLYGKSGLYKQRRKNDLCGDVPLNVHNSLLLIRSEPIVFISNQSEGLFDGLDFNENSGFLINTVSISDILVEYKKTCVDFIVGNNSITEEDIRLSNYVADLLQSLGLFVATDNDVNIEEQINNELVNVIVHDIKKLKLFPKFKACDSMDMFSIRAFNQQLSRIACLSDFVVYCFNETHTRFCSCSSVFRLLTLAQMHFLKVNPEFARLCRQRLFSGDKTFALDNDDCDLDIVLETKTNCGDDINDNGAFVPIYKTFILDTPRVILQERDKYGKLVASLPHYKVVGEIEEKSLFLDNCIRYEPSHNRFGFGETFLNDFDLYNLKNWNVNFSIKERFELLKVSSASQYLPGVWLGNEADYTLWQTLNKTMRSHFFQMEGAKDFEKFLCDTKISNYCDVNSSVLFGGDPLVKPKADWRLLVEVHGTTSFPPVNRIELVFRTLMKKMQLTYSQSILLSFPSSGTISGLGSLSMENIISMINVCRILHFKDHEMFPALIACPEGYTESSLLAVILLMYSSGICLKDALTELYIKRHRPYYLFPTDQRLLNDLQPIIHGFSPVYNKSESLKILTLSQETSDKINDLLIRGSNGNSMQQNSNWFTGYLSLVHGTLVPSRILPNLFLGSLEHANSVHLLNELQINNVISVGESLLWMQDLPETCYKMEPFGEKKACTLVTIDQQKLDDFFPELPKFCVSHVLLVNEIKDDGIDSLSVEILNDIFDFCELYTDVDYDSIVNQDLPQKLLVHCKVGVSRSATVVIGYMMKFLDMSLEQAYLFTRVRRLNIIIQPNLRLFYGLFELQQQLNLEKRKKSLQICQNGVVEQPSNLAQVVNSSIELPKRKKSSVSSASTDTCGSFSAEFKSFSKNPVIFEHASSKNSSQSSISSTTELETLWLRNTDWSYFCSQVDALNIF